MSCDKQKFKGAGAFCAALSAELHISIIKFLKGRIQTVMLTVGALVKFSGYAGLLVSRVMKDPLLAPAHSTCV